MATSVLILVFGVSILTGVISGLLGIGGGMILIPTLTLAFNFETQEAVAISLIAVVANSLAVVAIASKDGLPNIRLAMMLEPFAILFGMIGGFVGGSINGEILKKVFAVFTGVMALLFIFKKSKEASDPFISRSRETNTSEDVDLWRYYARREKTYYSYQPKRPLVIAMIMCLAGFLGGLLGIGGGALIVPAFHLVGSIPMHAATATSSYMMAMSGSGGAFYYFLKGDINWQAAAWVNVGIIIGAILSRKLAPYIKPNYLKKIFAVLLVVVAFKMWFS